jgi:hypothetical protein
LGRDGGKDLADGLADGIDGSRLGLSQVMFDLCEELFDRVRVRGLFRENKELGPGAPDCGANGCGLMRAEIVHDHEITGRSGRCEPLLDIDVEALAVDRLVQQPRRRDAIPAQGGQKRHGVPMAEGGFAQPARAFGRPASERRHIGLGPGLVDEDQPRGLLEPDFAKIEKQIASSPIRSNLIPL